MSQDLVCKSCRAESPHALSCIHTWGKVALRAPLPAVEAPPKKHIDPVTGSAHHYGQLYARSGGRRLLFALEGSPASRYTAHELRTMLAARRALWLRVQQDATESFPSCPLTEDAFLYYAEAAAMLYPTNESPDTLSDRQVEAVNTAILDLLTHGYSKGITGGYAGLKKWLRGQPWSLWVDPTRTPWFRVNPPGEEPAFPRTKTPWLLHFEGEAIEVGDDDEPESTPTIEDFEAADAFGRPAEPEESTRDRFERLIEEVRQGLLWLKT
ncbi:MAG TPA: hypothetical protein VL086_14510, partial [Candidatus Nitrosotalea sp.]|nr:hypothetical protein [Candidatus Nitrosotalea sp.]